MWRLNREYFYSLVGNLLFERRYNENVDSLFILIVLEMIVVIIII